jgi:hypothetical protein
VSIKGEEDNISCTEAYKARAKTEPNGKHQATELELPSDVFRKVMTPKALTLPAHHGKGLIFTYNQQLCGEKCSGDASKEEVASANVMDHPSFQFTLTSNKPLVDAACLKLRPSGETWASPPPPRTTASSSQVSAAAGQTQWDLIHRTATRVNDRHHIQHPHMTVAAVLNTSYYY